MPTQSTLRLALLVSLIITAVFGNVCAADSSPSPSPSPSVTPAPGPAEVEVPAYHPNPGKAEKPLKILILGGTGFTGPYQVRYAIARGHSVTVFNRGKTHPGILPDGVEQLTGDRNTGDVAALKGRKWDVVIDNPTMLPKWVHDAGAILKGNVERYIFISTISVYGDVPTPGLDETAPLAKYDGKDAMKETRDTVIASKFALYGPLKALSEKEVEKWFPGKGCIIRPGLIVGPGDETDRFTYWPVRIDRGGEVLAPGNPSDPVQFIDARDLAEWTIRMAEQGATGIYNATGPATPLTVGGMLDGIKEGLKANATFTFVPADFLEKEKVSPWSDMPVWVPPSGEDGGLGTISIKRALARGLTFRPLGETARGTLAWFRAQPKERQEKLGAGLTPEREAEVLAAWHKAKK
ncbi:MAG TPA: NAD-dependent epimerase/dehydratase family protein [Chthoniobacterales bacterium]|jgi:2'-hydroxyisoflavone reductase|nr:NAD-dependent epimerase/dehydratase family protein [Chthoniobacterales bacterium]